MPPRRWPVSGTTCDGQPASPQQARTTAQRRTAPPGCGLAGESRRTAAHLQTSPRHRPPCMRMLELRGVHQICRGINFKHVLLHHVETLQPASSTHIYRLSDDGVCFIAAGPAKTARIIDQLQAADAVWQADISTAAAARHRTFNQCNLAAFQMPQATSQCVCKPGSPDTYVAEVRLPQSIVICMLEVRLQ